MADPRLVFLLGAINIIALLLVFFSCRCLAGNRFVNKMMERGWYRKFYSRHCCYWWLLFVSVVLHAILAFRVFGSPF